MRTFVLAAAAVAFPLCVAAQSNPIRLQCEGEYSDYADSRIRNVPLKGMYIELGDAQARVVGTVGLDSTYMISRKTETSVCFSLGPDEKFAGCVNRFTGEFNVHEKAPGSHFQRLLTGVCKPAKPLF